MKRESTEPLITIEKITKRRKILMEEKIINHNHNHNHNHNISARAQDQTINIYIQEICHGPIIIQN